MAIGLNAVCVKSHYFSLVLSHLQGNTGFFWGRFWFMLSTEEARSTINFNDFCRSDACTVQCRTVSDNPGEVGGPLMTGTVVRLCCAKLPAQVLLSVCLFVPVPAVPALALKDNNYCKRSTTVSKSRGIGLGLAFIVLLLGLLWRCPQGGEFIPKDWNTPEKKTLGFKSVGHLLPSHKKRQAGRWIALKPRSHFLNLFLVSCLGYSSGTWCLLQLLTADLQCWGRRFLTKAMLFVFGALITVSGSSYLQQQRHGCHRNPSIHSFCEKLCHYFFFF